MPYIESEDRFFKDIKATGVLNQGQLKFLSYLYRFGPATTNELIDKIEAECPELGRNNLDLYDRKPAELKKLNVVKIIDKRKCRSTSRMAQVLGVTNMLPVKNISISGVAKEILEGAVDACLLGVEVYNKPRAVFKSEGYISLMIIAWTRAFHAYFRKEIGDKYFYKNNDGSPVSINGEKKLWDIQTCINKHGNLTEGVRKNLEFFIPLRNKIEHSHLRSEELDSIIFGECQSMLVNFENFLVKEFGEDYSINESLVYSLQFSQARQKSQVESIKSATLPKLKNIYKYIENYRKGLPASVLSSQDFRIKVHLVPVVSNTGVGDLAVEFTKLEDGQMIDGRKLTTIIKERVVEKKVVGKGNLLFSTVLERVNEKTGENKMNSHLLHAFNFVFSIKPFSKENKKPSDTNTKYCEYHQAFKQYQYTSDYVDLIVNIIENKSVILNDILMKYKSRKKMNLPSSKAIRKSNVDV